MSRLAIPIILVCIFLNVMCIWEKYQTPAEPAPAPAVVVVENTYCLIYRGAYYLHPQYAMVGDTFIGGCELFHDIKDADAYFDAIKKAVPLWRVTDGRYQLEGALVDVRNGRVVKEYNNNVAPKPIYRPNRPNPFPSPNPNVRI